MKWLRNRGQLIWFGIPITLIAAAVFLLQFTPGDAIPRVDLPPDTVYAVDWHPDGRTLAVGRHDGTIGIRDAASAETLRTLTTDPPAYVLALAYSPDGAQLVSGDELGRTLLWDPALGTLRYTLRTRSTQQISGVDWSPDGERVIAVNLFEAITEIWDAKSGQRLASNMQFGYLYDVDWVAGFSRIAVGVSARGIISLEEESARLLSTYAPGTYSVEITSVAWGPGGDLLVGGGHDGRIYVWSVGAAELLYVIEGHEYFVVDLAWSVDGTTLLSASYDGTLRAWDMTRRGAALDAFDAGGGLTAVVWHPDGQHFAYAGSSAVPVAGVGFGRLNTDGTLTAGLTSVPVP